MSHTVNITLPKFSMDTFKVACIKFNVKRVNLTKIFYVPPEFKTTVLKTLTFLPLQ